VYYVGGIQFAKEMSFDVKMEQVAKKFKPKFLEHGNGYAVFEYDLAHTATCACNHLRANATKREDWELSTNGSRLAVIEKNWTPPASQKKKEEDDNDNSSYAG
jgi:transposase-like protein